MPWESTGSCCCGGKITPKGPCCPSVRDELWATLELLEGNCAIDLGTFPLRRMGEPPYYGCGNCWCYCEIKRNGVRYPCGGAPAPQPGIVYHDKSLSIALCCCNFEGCNHYRFDFQADYVAHYHDQSGIRTGTCYSYRGWVYDPYPDVECPYSPGGSCEVSRCNPMMPRSTLLGCNCDPFEWIGLLDLPPCGGGLLGCHDPFGLCQYKCDQRLLIQATVTE